MRATKCDRCGQMVPHDGWKQKEYTDKTEAWARPLAGYRVRFSVEPVEDPTGYQGMELCDACMREVVSNAASKLGLSQREG